MQLAHVADLGPARIGALDAQRIGDHVHHDLPDLFGLGEDRMVLPADLLILRAPSVPSTTGASVKTACGSGKISP